MQCNTDESVGHISMHESVLLLGRPLGRDRIQGNSHERKTDTADLHSAAVWDVTAYASEISVVSPRAAARRDALEMPNRDWRSKANQSDIWESHDGCLDR